MKNAFTFLCLALWLASCGDVEPDEDLLPDTDSEAPIPGDPTQVELVNLLEEAAGENCEVGGSKVERGKDLNANGTLDPSEVVTTEFICDVPELVLTLINTVAEPPGGNCEFGGNAVQIGDDNNSNDTLELAEIDSIIFICMLDTSNLIPNVSFLIEETEEPEGENCENGGTRTDAGIDTNGNGSLEEGEIAITDYTCLLSIPDPG